jgi:hypothetical protein
VVVVVVVVVVAQAEAPPSTLLNGKKKKLIRVRRLKPGLNTDEPKPGDGKDADAKAEEKEASAGAGLDANGLGGAGAEGGPLVLGPDGLPIVFEDVKVDDEISKLVASGSDKHFKESHKPHTDITLGNAGMKDTPQVISDFLRSVTGGNRQFSADMKPQNGALRLFKGIGLHTHTPPTPPTPPHHCMLHAARCNRRSL